MKHIKLFEDFSGKGGLSPVDISKPGEVVFVLQMEDQFSVALVKSGSEEERMLEAHAEKLSGFLSKYPGIVNSQSFAEPGIAYVTLDHDGSITPLDIQERGETNQYPQWLTPTRERNLDPVADSSSLHLYASVLVRDCVLNQIGVGNLEVLSVSEFIQKSSRYL